MTERIIHSFEAGRRGKPDELESIIANSIGGFLLTLNPASRFDLDVSGDYIPQEDKFLISVGGEISESLLKISGLTDKISKGVLDLYNTINRTSFDPEKFKFVFNFKPQADILASNGEAGDIGHAIAVAYRNAPSYEPWERALAVDARNYIDFLFRGNKLTRKLTRKAIRDKIRFFEESSLWSYYARYLKNSTRELYNFNVKGLRPDGKVSVEVEYEGHVPRRINNMTICAEHETTLSIEELREKLTAILLSYFNDVIHNPFELQLAKHNIHINPLGAWNRGGWLVDSGNREAKPYRDGFATYGCCEDSFSGEDPSKPSGTGTFLARYVAVQVVGNNLADFARVALTYTAGSKEVGLNITTNGTAKIEQNEIEAWVRKNIPLGINDAIARFNLRNPVWYAAVIVASDYFHCSAFPWNKFEVKYK